MGYFFIQRIVFKKSVEICATFYISGGEVFLLETIEVY